MISKSDTAQADMIRIDQYKYDKNCALNSSNSGVITFKIQLNTAHYTLWQIKISTN